jgi:putative phage-type endonuclease
MILTDYTQGSPEWLTARLGVITGTKLKGVFKTNNLPLIDELIAEQMTELTEETRMSDAMLWGIEQEPRAMKEYLKIKKYKMADVGFCIHDEYSWLALSPDGFTEDFKGGTEIKCPTSKVHVEYCRTNKIPAKYKYQCHNYFHVNEKLEWLDFVSYDPRNKVRKINIVRITREEIQDELDAEMVEMLKFTEKWFNYYSKIVF